MIGVFQSSSIHCVPAFGQVPQYGVRSASSLDWIGKIPLLMAVIVVHGDAEEALGVAVRARSTVPGSSGNGFCTVVHCSPLAVCTGPKPVEKFAETITLGCRPRLQPAG